MCNPWIAGTAAAGLLLVVATGCGESSSARSDANTSVTVQAEEASLEGPPEDAIAIRVGRVERGSLSALYSTSATLRADKRATVTARTQGVVRELRVEEGDWVESGQPLAVLEEEEHRIAFDQAFANAETQLHEFERARSLHAQQLLSDEEFETARRDSVDSKHVADLAELMLSRTVIRATFSGRVLTRHLDVGATVSDGTPVYDIADLDPLYADVQVPERQVAQLSAGQTVRLTIDSDASSVEARARIERIAPQVDPSTGTVKVTVAVGRTDGLRPGSFVRVGIVTDTHENTLVVPRTALVAEGRRWHLFRVKEDNEYEVELVEVRRGFEESEFVEILDTVNLDRPLREGDSVVVTGASALSDESAVQVLDKDPVAETSPADDATSATSDGEEQGVAA